MEKGLSLQWPVVWPNQGTSRFLWKMGSTYSIYGKLIYAHESQGWTDYFLFKLIWYKYNIYRYLALFLYRYQYWNFDVIMQDFSVILSPTLQRLLWMVNIKKKFHSHSNSVACLNLWYSLQVLKQQYSSEQWHEQYRKGLKQLIFSVLSRKPPQAPTFSKKPFGFFFLECLR